MGNTVKTPRASEETNTSSQMGKHSFHSFPEKKMLMIHDRLSHVSLLTRLTGAASAWLLWEKEGTHQTGLIFSYVLAHFPRSTLIKTPNVKHIICWCSLKDIPSKSESTETLLQKPEMLCFDIIACDILYKFILEIWGSFI